jgi:hypothetical protein
MVSPIRCEGVTNELNSGRRGAGFSRILLSIARATLVKISGLNEFVD